MTVRLRTRIAIRVLAWVHRHESAHEPNPDCPYCHAEMMQAREARARVLGLLRERTNLDPEARKDLTQDILTAVEIATDTRLT